MTQTNTRPQILTYTLLHATTWPHIPHTTLIVLIVWLFVLARVLLQATILLALLTHFAHFAHSSLVLLTLLTLLILCSLYSLVLLTLLTHFSLCSYFAHFLLTLCSLRSLGIFPDHPWGNALWPVFFIVVSLLSLDHTANLLIYIY